MHLNTLTVNMTFFDLEKLRDKLAKENKLKAFVATYSNKSLEIKNLNTGKKMGQHK